MLVESCSGMLSTAMTEREINRLGAVVYEGLNAIF